MAQVMTRLRRRAGVASNQLLLLGVMLTGLMFSSLAIDMPLYFTAQNQLQTAANAAALAGASQLPFGEAEAEAAAYEYAAQNPVVGQQLQPSELTYSYSGSTFEVDAETNIPTMMSRLICGLQGTFGSSGGGPEVEGDGVGGGEEEESSSSSSCDYMKVAAHAKAVPAARDVVLVIDTSGSMDNLGGGQPFKDVKEAAVAYVDQVIALDSESVDRIAVVQFDYAANVAISLTSYSESNNFETVKSAINNLNLYSGSQMWNTNYHSGLQAALDEIEAHGRKNANKTVVFMTDGYPNNPDGPDWYYVDCINAHNQGNSYMSKYNYYKSIGQTSTANYWYNKAQQKYDTADTCATGYTQYMIDVTQAEAIRGNNMEVTVHTIQIGDTQESTRTKIRQMRRELTWDSGLLDFIADTTDGQQYAAQNNDGDGIMEIYETIAEDVHMRLAL